MSATAWLPIIVLLVLIATDRWVYMDAQAQAERGAPVVFATGSFKLATPLAWLAGCVFLWILFFPLCLASRR